MDTVAISTFKATCLELIERVRRTGQPLLITKRGEPVAQLLPPPPMPQTSSGFGSMRARGRELGDIVAPVGEEDWEALR